MMEGSRQDGGAPSALPTVVELAIESGLFGIEPLIRALLEIRAALVKGDPDRASSQLPNVEVFARALCRDVATAAGLRDEVETFEAIACMATEVRANLHSFGRARFDYDVRAVYAIWSALAERRGPAPPEEARRTSVPDLADWSRATPETPCPVCAGTWCLYGAAGGICSRSPGKVPDGCESGGDLAGGGYGALWFRKVPRDA